MEDNGIEKESKEQRMQRVRDAFSTHPLQVSSILVRARLLSEETLEDVLGILERRFENQGTPSGLTLMRDEVMGTTIAQLLANANTLIKEKMRELEDADNKGSG